MGRFPTGGKGCEVPCICSGAEMFRTLATTSFVGKEAWIFKASMEEERTETYLKIYSLSLCLFSMTFAFELLVCPAWKLRRGILRKL